MKNNKALKKTKKALKHRFWTEIYQGAKMFYFSGLINGKYLKTEVRNLSLYISRTKFRPLVWRNTHPYILVDRYEDVTHPNKTHEDPNVERSLLMYGYVRGTHLKPDARVHIIGAGDFNIAELSRLDDPCPLPTSAEGAAKKSLSQKDQLLYAPFSNAGSVLIDKDAVYINIGQVNYTKPEALDPASKASMEEEGWSTEQSKDHPTSLLKGLQDLGAGLDEKMGHSMLKLFRKGPAYDDTKLVDSSSSEEEEGNDAEEDMTSDDEEIETPALRKQPLEQKDCSKMGGSVVVLYFLLMKDPA